MKFSHLYEELKLLDICKPASPEEIERRNNAYPSIKIKELIDNANKTKLSDGSWHVHTQLDVSQCKLTSLKDLNVSIIDGDFSCSYNQLTSLEGGPKTVYGDFACCHNNLTSLVGAPTHVEGSFYCYNNELTSLNGSPTYVYWGYYCDNNKLTSLIGAPRILRHDFYCNNNKLTSLEGCPKEVHGYFSCYGNDVKFNKTDIMEICQIKGSNIKV
jgi:hypothetical protein